MVNYVTDNRVEEGVSLWDLLGIPESAGTDVVDRAWQRSQKTLDQHFAWKALRDPLYRALYQRTNSVDTLIHAGFFDDGLDCGVEELTASDPRFICTPLKKINKGISVGADQYILITTGAFSPVHNGHLAMMKAAIRKIEAEGNLVAGAYFCPGHDSYVGSKYGGSAKISAAERVHMLELACEADHDLSVDPWAARYLPCEVNFTDVMIRMRRYMEQHFRNDLKYAYVYGSDNAGFSEVLEGSDFRALPITRTEESSTSVRKGDLDLLPAPVREYLASKWPSGVYQIRDDKVGDPHLRRAVIDLLTETQAPNTIEVLDVDNQRRWAREILGDTPTISLDPLYCGTHNLDMCRVFHAADFQARGVISPRPNCDPIHIQAERIPKGDYVLVDDDVATGVSIRTAKLQLGIAGVNTVQDFILANLDTQPDDVMDVVDVRDFMINTLHGGLVVSHLDRLCRAPYLLPFVNLRTRAMIEPNREMALALRLWKFNRQAIAYAHGEDMKLGACVEDFQVFATKHGWSSDTTLVDYCDFHIRVLEEAQGKPCTPV